MALLGVAACGDSDSSVDVVGKTIDFGATDCGTTAIPRVLTVTNNTARSFTFSTGLGLGADSPYTVVPPSGAVLPRSQFTVMIYSKPIPQDSEITENLYGDTLTVTTDMDGDSPHTVDIKQTAHGAIFHADADAVNIASPTGLGMTGTASVTITNVGNAEAKLDAQSSFVAFGLAAQGMSIPPGESVSTMLTYTPSANVTEEQTIALSGTGPVCGTPQSLRVSGTGTAKGQATRAVLGSFRGQGYPATLCTLTNTKVVACGGVSQYGERGAPEEYLRGIEPLSGKGGGGGGGGLARLDVVNVVQTKSGYLTNVVELVAINSGYCARTESADMYCWGDYLGIGGQNPLDPARHNPYAVLVGSNVRTIAGGYHTRCAVTEPDGATVCRSQPFGNGNVIAPSLWVVTGATSISTSGVSGYAIVTGGNVMSFGKNNYGERGNSDDELDPPSFVQNLTSVAQVAAGGRRNNDARFGCARKTDGTVWCWGGNQYGQLGDSTVNGTNTPVQVVNSDLTPLAATHITAGFRHACAIDSGSVKCWGYGIDGALGNNNGSSISTAVPTDPPLANVVSVEAANSRGTCATLSNGSVRCWGNYGDQNYYVPEPVFAFEP